MNIKNFATMNLLNFHFGNKSAAETGTAAKNNGLIKPNPAVDQFIPTNITPPAPNWNDVMSKTDPAMSEEEFAEAIASQAKNDFANGHRRAASNEAGTLLRQYMQTASPDRKGLYEASIAKNGGKLNQTHAIWDEGERVMTYNTTMGKWMTNGTGKEMERMQQFYEIYNTAYEEAMKTGS